MALIKKSDLRLDYTWPTQHPSEAPIDHDDLGSTFFDRNNGDNVLSLINNYAERRGYTAEQKDEALRAEPVIREQLPKDLRTEDDAMNWLWKFLGNEDEKTRI